MMKLRIFLVAAILLIIGGMYWMSPNQYVPSKFFHTDQEKAVQALINDGRFVIQFNGGHSITTRYAQKPLVWLLTPVEVNAEKLLSATPPVQVDIASLTALDDFRHDLVGKLGTQFANALRQEGFTVGVEEVRGQKLLNYYEPRGDGIFGILRSYFKPERQGIVRFTSGLSANRDVNLELFIHEH